MRSEEDCLAVHKEGIDAKNHEWEEHGLRDSPMKVAMVFRDRDDVIVPPMPAAGAELLPATIIRLIMESIPDKMGKLEEVWMVLDGFGIELDEGEELPDDYVRGNMADDFRDNPESKISECLTTYIIVDDLVGGCEATIITQFYALADGGHFTWSDHRTSTDMTGMIPDAVTGAWPRGS